MGWNIRWMEATDYDQVYRLWRNTPGMGLNNLDDSREGIGSYLKRNPKSCYVAEEDGRIVGAILAGHDGRRGFIYHTTVSPEYQKRGIGRALVDHAMEALEAEGIHKVALVAFARNEKGNGFWERMGFSSRSDLVYRNKSIHEMERIDT